MDEFETSGEELEEERDGGRTSPSGKPRDEIIVKVIDCNKKENNDWVYDIEVSLNGEKHTLQRNYKDVQWLHRVIMRDIELGGHIIPPLPPSPSTMPDLPSSAIIAKGDAMFGGLSRRHTLRLELFLQTLADQKFYADNHIIYNFLINKQLGNHDNIGSNVVMSNISKVYSNFTLSGLQDPDEKFDSFLKYVNEMCTKLEVVYERFSEFIFSWQKLGNFYVLTKAALEDVAICDKGQTDIAHIENQMAEGLFDIGVNECLLSLDAVLSLAVVLSFESGYFLHCKEMLQRRQTALQSFLNANQQLDKAKPDKKDAAEKLKVKAEGEFHSLSRIAEKEVEVFTGQYCSHLKRGLQSYAEAQVAHSKRTLEALYQIKELLAAD